MDSSRFDPSRAASLSQCLQRPTRNHLIHHPHQVSGASSNQPSSSSGAHLEESLFTTKRSQFNQWSAHQNAMKAAAAAVQYEAQRTMQFGRYEDIVQQPPAIFNEQLAGEPNMSNDDLLPVMTIMAAAARNNNFYGQENSSNNSILSNQYGGGAGSSTSVPTFGKQLNFNSAMANPSTSSQSRMQQQQQQHLSQSLRSLSGAAQFNFQRNNNNSNVPCATGFGGGGGGGGLNFGNSESSINDGSISSSSPINSPVSNPVSNRCNSSSSSASQPRSMTPSYGMASSHGPGSNHSMSSPLSLRIKNEEQHGYSPCNVNDADTPPETNARKNVNNFNVPVPSSIKRSPSVESPNKSASSSSSTHNNNNMYRKAPMPSMEAAQSTYNNFVGTSQLFQSLPSNQLNSQRFRAPPQSTSQSRHQDNDSLYPPVNPSLLHPQQQLTIGSFDESGKDLEAPDFVEGDEFGFELDHDMLPIMKQFGRHPSNSFDALRSQLMNNNQPAAQPSIGSQRASSMLPFFADPLFNQAAAVAAASQNMPNQQGDMLNQEERFHAPPHQANYNKFALPARDNRFANLPSPPNVNQMFDNLMQQHMFRNSISGPKTASQSTSSAGNVFDSFSSSVQSSKQRDLFTNRLTNTLKKAATANQQQISGMCNDIINMLDRKAAAVDNDSSTTTMNTNNESVPQDNDMSQLFGPVEPPPKKKRGRPRKVVVDNAIRAPAPVPVPVQAPPPPPSKKTKMSSPAKPKQNMFLSKLTDETLLANNMVSDVQNIGRCSLNLCLSNF